MADHFEVPKAQAEMLYRAVQDGDRVTATTLMEELGSCAWPSLIRQTKAMTQPADALLLQIRQANSETETVELHRIPSIGSPLATITDTRCERKR